MRKTPNTLDRLRERNTISRKSLVRICIGAFEFNAHFEEENAPRTCNLFKTMLPLKKKIFHARWSGEAGYIPLGDFNPGIGYENQTSHPAPGQLLFYSFGASEAEILLPYGGCTFSSKVGQLAGNHFLTIANGHDQLVAFGRSILWEGAQNIVFEAC
jgi:hypothetical protein